MVMKNQLKKVKKSEKILKNEKVNKPNEKTLKNEKINKPDEDDLSFDDMSDDELIRMLGNSDGSEVESDDFSAEEIETKKVPSKKRRLENDDETENVKLKKTKIEEQCEDDDNEEEEDNEEEDDEEEDDDEDEDEDEDDDIEEGSCDEEENMEVDIVPKKDNKHEIAKLSKKQDIKDNIKTEANDEYKKIFIDTPKIESETLRKEIKDRLIKRKNNSFVISNLPYKFNYAMAKELVPDMVSMILPYNLSVHKISGNVYIDVKKPEDVSEYVKKLNDFTFKTRKLKAFPLSKIDEDIDNYNCTRLAVSNLSFSAKPDSIKTILTKATNIVMMPVKGRDKKISRVAFAEYRSAEDAISEMDEKHGAELNGIPINLKFQSKTNTNMRTKNTFIDHNTLKVYGISKSIKEAEVKKLFPQATSILWKSGDQMATIKYESTDDCKVDMTNAIKNRPSPTIRIYFNTTFQKRTVKSDTTPVNTKDKKSMKKDGSDKVKKHEGKNLKFGNKKKFDKKEGKGGEKIKEFAGGKGLKKNFKPKDKKNWKNK